MIVSTRNLLLLSLCVFAPMASAAERITAEQAASLDEWAVLTTNDIEPIEFDLGEWFAGDQKSGRITVRNLSSRAVKLGDIKTTCGCTAAVKLDQAEIKPKGETTVVVILRESRTGKFGSQIKLSLGQQTYVVSLSGLVRPVFAANSPVVCEDQMVELRIQTNDPRVNVEKLKFKLVGKGFTLKRSTVQDRLSTLRIQCSKQAGDFIAVIPRLGSREYPPIRVAFQRKGEVTIFPRIVFLKDSAPHFSFIVRGDFSVLDGQRTAFEIDKKRYDCKVSSKSSGPVLLVTATNPFAGLASDRYSAFFVVGENRLPFTLQVR